METVRVFRFYGLTETALRERLTDVLHMPQVSAEIESEGLDVWLRLHAQDVAMLDEAAAAVREQANVYLYSTDGSDLPTRVVRLLQQRHKTIAFAESCTGGMIASAVTGVAGASQVFGTGVVSYSGTCKEKMLRVRRDTLRQHGAVSAATAKEMARGVRTASGADIGVSVTGEAGPNPAEQPVGTVFIGLADSRRTWVREWHLDTPDADRNTIRRAAAGHALDLARRYLEAYPAVMAGGDAADDPPPTRTISLRRLPSLLPQRGDSRRKWVLTIAALAAALLVLVGGIAGLYRYINAPTENQELQDSLRHMYHGDTVTEAETLLYPQGMTAQFRNLYDMNVNVAGWLHINDTVIDYPVMLHSDEFYESHNFADELSYYGQPYVNDADYTALMRQQRVRIVYGNNTEDGQMFSTLLSYRRPAFLHQHPTIAFHTVFDTALYEIFAVMVVDGSESAVWRYDRIEFADDADYEQYIAAIRARSLFDCDASVTAADRLLLLTTQARKEYGRANARLVVAARRVAAASEEPPTYRWNTDVRMPESWQQNKRTTKTVQGTTTTTSAAATVTTATTDTNGAQSSVLVTTVTTTETQPSASAVTSTETTTTTLADVTATTSVTATTETVTTQTQPPQTESTTIPVPDEDTGGDMETEENDNTGD